MTPDQIALQLYTVRRLAADDLPGTLRAVATAGYRSVELAGLPERPATELRRLLDEAGLQAIAAHQGIDRLRADLDGAADRLVALGCPRLIVPWLPETDRGSSAEIRGFAAELNEIAGRLADRGLRLGYHNHAFEFEPLEGTTAWDVLLAELAQEVELELDVYWASVGGRDPVEVLRGAADRVRLLHLKDRAPGPEPRDAPAGSGVLDMAAVVAAGRDARVEWYIAEQDEPGDAVADIATAYETLSRLASA